MNIRSQPCTKSARASQHGVPRNRCLFPSTVYDFSRGDALASPTRLTRVASEVGGVGLVVNSKPLAVDFYKRFGLEPTADHPLNVFLPI